MDGRAQRMGRNGATRVSSTVSDVYLQEKKGSRIIRDGDGRDPNLGADTPRVRCQTEG